MIPTTPESKPIEATEEQELLAQAYALLRQVKHVLKLLEPSPDSMADTKAAVRDFCILYEARVREGGQASQKSPAPMLVTAAPPESPTGVLSQVTGAAVSISTTEF